MNPTITNIIAILLPDASPSRTRMLERSLRSMAPAQLEDTRKAVAVAITSHKLSQIRDLVESRDLLTIGAISKWNQWVNLRDLEGALSQELGVRDLPYDMYSPAFEAHVEAYVTYHSHCSTNCDPYDFDIDYRYYGDMQEPEPGHYADYLQDAWLMHFVEKYPEKVSELVKLAAERRGINESLLKEYFDSESAALSSGLL